MTRRGGPVGPPQPIALARPIYEEHSDRHGARARGWA